jgi:hypothetical protein
MENARFSVDVTCDEATLHETYLPHFRRVVGEGVYAIMSAYNSVNGEWCGQNELLLTGVPRDQWRFRGVVVSDFVWGLRDAVLSLRAGLDVEEPFRQQRAQHLPAALEDGRASWADVERAGVRILAAQLRHAASLQAPPPPVLPLGATELRSLAVIGRLADEPGTGDHGSSDVRAPEVVTALAGLRAALPGVDVRHTAADDPAAATALAAECDAAVIVAGFTAEDEGEFVDPEAFGRPYMRALYPPAPDPELAERLIGGRPASHVGSGAVGGDRARLTLRPVDEDIIRAVAATNPRTIVAVRAAGAVLMENWRHSVPAIAMAWLTPAWRAAMRSATSCSARWTPPVASRSPSPPTRHTSRRSTATRRRSRTTAGTGSGCSTASASRLHTRSASACRTPPSSSTAPQPNRTGRSPSASAPPAAATAPHHPGLRRAAGRRPRRRTGAARLRAGPRPGRPIAGHHRLRVTAPTRPMAP